MARRRDLGVLLATVLIATAGCDQYRDDAPSVAHTVRPSATPLASPPSGVWAVGSGSPEPVGATVQRRATVLRVGPGLRPYRLLFHDTDHGYALLSDCPFRYVTVSLRRPDRHCRGALAATADAGRSWSMGTLPDVDGDDWLMTTLGPRELLLNVRRRYYESVDAGRTFTPSTKKFGPGGPIGVDGLGSVGQQVPSAASATSVRTAVGMPSRDCQPGWTGWICSPTAAWP
ncbi:hypothetical protein I0C86_30335 [Plantactinospora sp. S1510]|uniref:Exo-alpha-sialidase n=1 Tax=Plantactinospora alkalitolerans TaxID=2789879 RepID=A0ABS0H4F7_9ACTN|nr:hypothetical protein [Plantactinospora alkalitolerans]MBF9133229.1 hypothetical protein [Plantactinospora alkalitolerans]